jgi:DNA-binding MarR family transcriptional regulator
VPRKLTQRQRVALQYIARRPDCSHQALADEMNVSISTAAGYIDRLRLKGFVKKPMGTKTFVLTRPGIEALCSDSLKEFAAVIGQ